MACSVFGCIGCAGLLVFSLVIRVSSSCHVLVTIDSDEGIPTSLPSSVDDIAGRVDVQHKPDDLCTGPIIRARAKFMEQQVNSLLTEYNLFTNENFILPNVTPRVTKTLIRVVNK
jgi:hypothetical protein